MAGDKKKAPGMKIKKGDKVVVIAGKDKGREGTVIAAYPDKQQVLVEGANMITKNEKVNYQGGRGAGRSYKEGGQVHQEARIHVSNVALIDPDSKKPARAGYRAEQDKDSDRTKKVRFSRTSGKGI
jgi:large subunit ribosomal protein L24